MDKKILLVDDNKLFLEIQKEFLQYTKTDIFTACDGLEALNVAHSVQPDLIFMDLEMPKMDGATCCKAIKNDPKLNCIPVVMVTSQTKEEAKDYCYATGCDAFISKPLDRDNFLGIARSFIPDLDRREKRYKVRLEASITVKDKILPCTLNNLSAGGAYVVTDYFGTPNEVIKISILLPNSQPIECQGRIAWVNRVDSILLPKGLGLKFALMPKDTLHTLMAYLDICK